MNYNLIRFVKLLELNVKLNTQFLFQNSYALKKFEIIARTIFH